MSAGRDLALLADVCERECRDGFWQLVSRALTPERYGDHAASGLEATIRAGAKHELAFDLVK